MDAIKNHLAATIAITTALSLTGCDIALQRRAEQAEAKVAVLEEKLKEAEEKASQAYDYRRAAGIAEACDFPLVWRLCPQQDLSLGKSALQNSYTADQGVFWAARIGLLAALGAALGMAVAVGRAVWLHIVVPLEEEVEQAEQLVKTAKERAEKWKLAERQAQRSAQQAAEEAAATREELAALAAQKIDLEADLQAVKAELKRAQADLEALRGGFL
jgi:nucleotide-binding universal stress UspA family protein